MAILIVNNDQATQSVLRETLVGEGFEIFCANSFNEAFAYLMDASVLPELVFLDTMMANSEGWQFLAVQQNDPDLRKIPTVLLSSVSVKNVISLQRAEILSDLIDPRLLLKITQVYCATRREVRQSEAVLS